MKRRDELRGLSDDHHTALVVAARCIRAAEASIPELWAAVQTAIESHFEPHFQIEEEILLPALRAVGEAALADRIREEHAALRRAGCNSMPDAAALHEFGQLLHDHVRFEERDVFEPLQHRLPAEALRALDRACARMPRVCPADLLRPPASKR